MTPRKRNWIGSIAIAGLMALSMLVAPDEDSSATVLQCTDRADEVVIGDRGKCGRHVWYRPEICSCVPIKNPWWKYYWFGLVPISLALIGVVVLRGRLLFQLLLLNASVAAGVLVTFIGYVLYEADAMMGVVLLPLIVGFACLAVSVAFLLLSLIIQKFRVDTP